jgi:outer membrane protein TolC
MRGIVVVLALAPVTAAAQPKLLTIEDAIKLATTRNERAQIADLDVVVADADVAKARVAFLPVLNANGNYTIHPIDDPVNTAQATLSLSQPLINPPAFARYAAAKHDLASQRAQSFEDKRKVAFDASKAFIAVLLADQVVQAAQRKLDTAKLNLADTDAHVKAQLVSSNDVTRAQIQLAEAARELATDQGKLRASYVQLGFVTNSPIVGAVDQPATLVGASQQAPVAEDALVADGVHRRADLVAAKESALASHDNAREPRLQYLPTLSVNGQLTASTVGKHDLEPQIALTASWLIYDGGARHADIRARDAQADIADRQTAALQRSIEADVRSAAIQLAAAQQALASARDARDASRKGSDEAAILYKQGLAKAIELVDANEQRFVAEVNYATAEFDVVNAYLALRQAMGLAPLEAAP